MFVVKFIYECWKFVYLFVEFEYIIIFRIIFMEYVLK